MTTGNGNGQSTGTTRSAQRPEAKPRQKDEMTAQQHEHWKRILVEIDARAGMLNELAPVPESKDAKRMGLPSLDRDRRSNVLVIDGARGTGKSTVLLSVVQACVRTLVGAKRREHEFEHAVPLVTSVIDFVVVSDETPVLSLFVQSFERLVKSLLDLSTERGRRRRYDDDAENEHSQLEATWFNLQRIAAHRARRAPGQPTLGEEATVLLSEQAGAFLELDDVLGEFLRELESAWKRAHGTEQDKGRMVVVVPIDDADAHEARCVQLVKLLRGIYHPQLVFVLAADLAVVRHMLNDHFVCQFVSRPSEVIDTFGSYRISEEGKVLADRLTVDLLARVFPATAQFRLRPLTDEEALRIELPEVCRPARTIQELLAPLGELTWSPLSSAMNAPPRVRYPGLLSIRLREFIDLSVQLARVRDAHSRADVTPAEMAARMAKTLYDAALERSAWRREVRDIDRVALRAGASPNTSSVSLECDVTDLEIVLKFSRLAKSPSVQHEMELSGARQVLESCAIARQLSETSIRHRSRQSRIADGSDHALSPDTAAAVLLCFELVTASGSSDRMSLVGRHEQSPLSFMWDHGDSTFEHRLPVELWDGLMELDVFNAMWVRWLSVRATLSRAGMARIFVVAYAITVYASVMSEGQSIRETVQKVDHLLANSESVDVDRDQSWTPIVEPLGRALGDVPSRLVKTRLAERLSRVCSLVELECDDSVSMSSVLLAGLEDEERTLLVASARRATLRELRSNLSMTFTAETPARALWTAWSESLGTKVQIDANSKDPLVVVERQLARVRDERIPGRTQNLSVYWRRPSVASQLRYGDGTEFLKAMAGVRNSEQCWQVLVRTTQEQQEGRELVSIGKTGAHVRVGIALRRGVQHVARFGGWVFSASRHLYFDWEHSVRKLAAIMMVDMLADGVAGDGSAQLEWRLEPAQTPLQSDVLPFSEYVVHEDSARFFASPIVPRFPAIIDYELLQEVWCKSLSGLVRENHFQSDLEMAFDRAMVLLVESVGQVYWTRSSAPIAVRYSSSELTAALRSGFVRTEAKSERSGAYLRWIESLAVVVAPEFHLSAKLSAEIVRSWKLTIGGLSRQQAAIARRVVDLRKELWLLNNPSRTQDDLDSAGPGNQSWQTVVRLASRVPTGQSPVNIDSAVGDTKRGSTSLPKKKP